MTNTQVKVRQAAKLVAGRFRTPRRCGSKAKWLDNKHVQWFECSDLGCDATLAVVMMRSWHSISITGGNNPPALPAGRGAPPAPPPAASGAAAPPPAAAHPPALTMALSRFQLHAMECTHISCS